MLINVGKNSIVEVLSHELRNFPKKGTSNPANGGLNNNTEIMKYLFFWNVLNMVTKP